MRKTGFAFLLLVQSLVVYAQDSTETTAAPQSKLFMEVDQGWTIEVPIWIPGFRGEYTYGDISLEGADGFYPEPVNPIEPDPPPPPKDNIFSRFFSKSTFFRLYFLGRIEYASDRFLAELLGFSGTVGNDITFRLGDRYVTTVKYTTGLGRLFVGYALYDHINDAHSSRFTVHGYLGVKTHWVELYSELDRIQPKLDADFVWTQAVFGIQIRYILRDWLFKLQGDVAGVTERKDYSHMIHAFVHYRISSLISVKLGWTDWDLNHSRMFRDEPLTLNVHLSGPSSGVGFHF